MFCLQKGNLLYFIEQILTLSILAEHYSTGWTNVLFTITCGQSHENHNLINKRFSQIYTLGTFA